MSDTGNYNVVMRQGATFARTWATDQLTNHVGVSSQIRVRVAPQRDAPLVFSLSTANGRIALSSDGTLLTATLLMDGAATVDIPPGSYYYTWELVAPSAGTLYPLAGEWTITPST